MDIVATNYKVACVKEGDAGEAATAEELDWKVLVVKRHNHCNQEILEVSGSLEPSRKVPKKYLCF